MEFILKAKTTIPRIESNSFLWVAPSMGGSLQMSCIKRKMLILCKATSMRSLMWGSLNQEYIRESLMYSCLNPLVCIYIYLSQRGYFVWSEV